MKLLEENTQAAKLWQFNKELITQHCVYSGLGATGIPDLLCAKLGKIIFRNNKPRTSPFAKDWFDSVVCLFSSLEDFKVVSLAWTR